MDCPKNGIICGTAMAEKRLEKGKVRYSAAYPTGVEHFRFRRISSMVSDLIMITKTEGTNNDIR